MNYGITVADFNFLDLITMTVTVADPDLNFFELDWKWFRFKRYKRIWLSMAKFAPHMDDPHGDPQTSPQHMDLLPF